MKRYILQEEVGRGSSGVVYKAFDTVTKESVAIKQFVKGAARPKREIIVGRRITHPNICKIYEHFETEDGSDCLVMEYVDGGNLRTLIQRSQGLSLDKALSIAGQILDGLEASHQAQMVHGDLKPENILLTSDHTVKLCDFGHARPIGTSVSADTLRGPGTPGYLAPEQVIGGKCDSRTDIFVFGRILQELLPDEMPEHIEAVIKRCGLWDPSQRFASVSELRQALNGTVTKPKFAAIFAASAFTLLIATIPVWNHFSGNHKAAQAFSDGSYFLQNGFAAEALERFDAALAFDPAYPSVQYYRGLALEKLDKPDEAIDAFKRALPRSEPERRVLWSWDVPYSSPATPEHGIIRGMDNIQVHLQRDFFESRKDVVLQKAVIFGERKPGTTVLHFLNLERQRPRRVEIPDDQITLNTNANANGLFTVMVAKNWFYAFSADGTRLWRKDLTDYGTTLPKSGLVGDAFYVYSPELKRFDLFDARTGNLLWRKDEFPIESLEPPLLRRTKAFGDLLIVKSGSTYRAIRKSNGKEAWVLSAQSEKVASVANEKMLIVLDPDRRIFTADLETGKTLSEVDLEQYVDALPFRPTGRMWLVGALLDGSALYVMSSGLELYAISIEPRLRVLWHTPIQKKMQAIRVHGSHVYLGTDSGEVIVMDAATGAITKATKLTDKPLLIDYAGNDAVLVASNNMLYGLDPLGAKRWEYASVDPLAEATYFNGTITVYTSPQQMSALDVRSGDVLWQYAGTQKPYVFVTRSASARGAQGRQPEASEEARSLNESDRFFIVEENGVKEYEIRPGLQNVTDKEPLTELARTYQAKGDLVQARMFVDKASDIDPNYPPLELVRSRLSKAQGHADDARRELARYASLVGIESKEGQNAVSELKRDYGLLWETAVSPDIAGDPVIMENRLVSVGRRVGHELALVALDAQTGAVGLELQRRAVSCLGDGGAVHLVCEQHAGGWNARQSLSNRCSQRRAETSREPSLPWPGR